MGTREVLVEVPGCEELYRFRVPDGMEEILVWDMGSMDWTVIKPSGEKLDDGIEIWRRAN